MVDRNDESGDSAGSEASSISRAGGLEGGSFSFATSRSTHRGVEVRILVNGYWQKWTQLKPVITVVVCEAEVGNTRSSTRRKCGSRA